MSRTRVKNHARRRPRRMRMRMQRRAAARAARVPRVVLARCDGRAQELTLLTKSGIIRAENRPS